MLRLTANPAPRWIDLPLGVRVEVVPLSTTFVMDVYAELSPRIEVEDVDDDATGRATPTPERTTRFDFVTAVARSAILAWEGVADDKDKPAPVTPENIGALMRVPQVFFAFQKLVVQPALAVVAEGNASAPSPDGTSAAA